MALPDSRPDATQLWEQLDDDATDPSPDLREELRSHGAIVSVGDEVEWFGQWLNDGATPDSLVFSIGETEAETTLAAALSGNMDALSAAGESIDHPSADEWEDYQLAKFLYSAARGEMSFIQLEPGRHGTLLAHPQLSNRRMTNPQVRMLRVAELRLVQAGPSGTDFLLFEEEGVGRPEHLIAETICPMEDKVLRHYDGCIPQHGFQRPDDADELDWASLENTATSFHAMARGLHEEVIRPLALQLGMVDESEAKLPTEPESCLLRTLLNSARQINCRLQWPKKGSLVSGSLPGMVSSYCMSTWDIGFAAHTFEEYDRSGDAWRMAGELCNLDSRIENTWSSRRPTTYLVWKPCSSRQAGIQLATCAHHNDFGDLVTAWSQNEAAAGGPSGRAARLFNNLDLGLLSEEDHSELRRELEGERVGQLPFPGWFAYTPPPISEPIQQDDATNPQKIERTCDMIRDQHPCPTHQNSDGESIPAGVDCPSSQRPIYSRYYGGVNHPNGITSVCRARFRLGIPPESRVAWPRQAITYYNENIAVRPPDDDWFCSRWIHLMQRIDPPSPEWSRGLDRIDLDREGDVLLQLQGVSIVGEDGDSRPCFVLENEGWRWNPCVDTPFGDGWWPGIDIRTSTDEAVDTLESLQGGSFEHIVLREDAFGVDGRRMALCLVRIDDWLDWLRVQQEIESQPDEDSTAD